MNFSPHFLFSIQQAAKKKKQTRGATGHLGLVMAKLGEINFNLESAIECTWPRTPRDGRRVLL